MKGALESCVIKPDGESQSFPGNPEPAEVCWVAGLRELPFPGLL